MATVNPHATPLSPQSPANIKPLRPLAATMATCLALSAAPAFAATYTVDSATDDGIGVTLRDAINSANGDATADTITFAAALSGQTITLAGTQIDITDTASLTIDASNLPNGITISGDNASRVFGVTENQALTLNNLTITQGRTTVNSSGALNCASGATLTRGGAICAEGDLTLIDSTISGNSTAGSGAHGGSFWARGTASLSNSTVSGNSTAGNYAAGGGFWVFADAILTNSTVSGNSTTGSNARGGGFYAFNDATLLIAPLAKTRRNMQAQQGTGCLCTLTLPPSP